jgi:prevent-host-death family protein
MMHTITLEEAYQAFDSLLEKVNRGEEVTIERGGTPVAVLIPPARYQLIRESARRRLGDMLRELEGEAFALDPDEAERLAVKIVEEIREEQRSLDRSRARVKGIPIVTPRRFLEILEVGEPRP